MKRTIIALLMALVMLVSITACSAPAETPAEPSAPTESEAPADTAAPEEPAAEVYNIGICQLMPHAALDAATQGFMDALEEALPNQVNFDHQDAAGDVPTCATIVNGFVAADVDLIMANATPALQSAVTATGEIPILGTSVTEYGVALSIENFNGLVGSNVSGTSDLAPLDAQAEMIKTWFPDAKNVGLLYCNAEANSQYQVDTVEKYLTEMGYTCTQYPFSDSNDLAAVTQAAADNSDVIYVPTDNTIASNAGIVDNVCRPAGIPVMGGDEGICHGCGVATLCIGYYDLGVATGKMAAKVLTGEANIAEMPIEYAPEFTQVYNETICADLGLTAPEGYVPTSIE